LRRLKRHVSRHDFFEVLVDVEVHHFAGQRECSAGVGNSDVARRAAAPQALQHAERSVAALVQDRELDRGVFERADRRSPSVVVARARVRFSFLKRHGQVFNVFDFGTVDGKDGVETEDYFSGHFLFRELGYTEEMKFTRRYPSFLEVWR